MFRLAAILALLCVSVIVAISNAATISINGGTLQAFVLDGPELPPPPPEGVTASAQPAVTTAGRFSLAGAVQVTWLPNDPDEDVTEYRVYRAQDYSGEFNRIGTAEAPAFTDGDVEEGEAYVYYVTAVNEVGESPPSDEASAEVPVDCEALEGSDGYDAAVGDGDCPELTPTPTPETTAEVLAAEDAPDATSMPESTSTPQPTPTSTPFPTRTPTVVPTATPQATETPLPTNTPAPTDTPQPTATPAPTEAPTQEPTVEPTEDPTQDPPPDVSPQP